MVLYGGLRVEIISEPKYNHRLDGKQGVIEKYDDRWDTIGVKIDGHKNKNGRSGCYWFSKNNIKVIESENCEMMSEKFVVAGIKFLEGTNMSKEYYYALYDENVKVDDIVVVMTGHHGLAVAKVSSIGEVDKELVQCGREIISKVDLSEYKRRVNRRNDLAKLKEQMDKKVKELQATAIYELLAKEDESLAAMLKEYKSLLG